jgi:hypothetical protein
MMQGDHSADTPLPTIKALGTDKTFVYLLPLFSLALAIFWGNSRVFYYWDNVIYHELSRWLLPYFPGRIPQMLYDTAHTVLYWDYNSLPALLPAFFMWVFGSSRPTYLVAICVVYFVPTVWMMCVLVKDVSRHLSCEKQKTAVAFFAILLFPYLLYIVCNGYADVGGGALMLLCIHLYFFSDRRRAHRMIACGLLLFVLTIFRRWYVFWCVAFAVCATVDHVVSALRTKEYRKSAASLALLALFYAGPLCLQYRELVVDRLILSDVVSAYKAYALGLGFDANLFLSRFGILVLVAVLAAAVFLAFRRKAPRIVAFLSGQAVLCFFLFTRVQSHNVHHLMLYVPFLFTLLAMGATYLHETLDRRWQRVMTAALALVASFGFVMPFVSGIKTPPLLPTFKMQTARATNVREVLSLTYYLDGLSENSGKTVLILSSSGNLNSEMIAYSERSFNLSDRERDYILPYPSIDRRDGFSESIFTADYVVVPSRIEVYLGEENQRVIAEPTRYFHERKGFANAFEKLPVEFALSDDCVVSVYERTRAVTDEEAADLRAHLAGFYPDLPELFPG